MIPFTKMQAVGNDFVVIEEPENIDLSALAARVCDRRFGIGADGLLTYKPTDHGLHFRIFNADGSEDTMCGNGLRCVVRLAVERGVAPDEGVARTRAGEVRYLLQGKQATLALPPPEFWQTSIPGATTVDTGSLHTVLWPTSFPTDTAFVKESAALETNPLFPEKTSVLWAVVTGTNRIQLRIWERGVGETLGCGTGACAAAVVAVQSGRAQPATPIDIGSPGGALLVSWNGLRDSPILLTGPAETVFSGTLSLWI